MLSVVQEILPKYDELRSYATGGSYDNWFMKTFRLTKILNFKPFKSFYHRTYFYPFAQQRFNKEIHLDYVEFLRSLYNLQLKGKGSSDIDESIELISNRLKKLPPVKKKNYRKLHLFWKVLSWSVPSGLMLSWLTNTPEYHPLILLFGVMALILSIPFICDKLFEFFIHKHWYHRTQKNLGISKLKKQLLEELIQTDKS